MSSGLILWTGVLIKIVSYCGANSFDHHPKWYKINLDLNRTEVWREVVTDHREIIHDARILLMRFFPEKAIPIIEVIAKDAETILSPGYAAEMNGIATFLNMSVGEIITMNLLYDIIVACTSIVCLDPDGQLWHARNLDFTNAEIVKKLTVGVDFVRDGQVVYSGVTYAGFVGLLTGQRPKSFTITVDERDKGPDIYNFLVAIGFQSFVPVSFLVRDSLEKDSTFGAAIMRLGGTPTAAPVYFIVGGTFGDQAAVITKGRVRVADFCQIDVSRGQWFLVETNYDHWQKPPETDRRGTVAKAAILSMGRNNISVYNLYKVMSIPPVLNVNTTYTIVMSAAKPDLMTTWIRG